MVPARTIRQFTVVLVALAALGSGALAQESLFLHHGKAAGNLFGWSVSGVGDVNNDGVPDLLAGAPCDNTNGTSSGSATVFSGADGAVVYSFLGATGSLLGMSVGNAGDVNNDGILDLLVGAPSASGPAGVAGAATVYSGAGGAVLHTFTGALPGANFGYSVSAAGDVNDDGCGDVIASAPSELVDGYPAGVVRVYSGADGSQVCAVHGSASLPFGSGSVCGVDDVDGDGADDFVIGAPFADGAVADCGLALVCSGKSGALLRTCSGEQPNELSGESVSGTGDLDGDGVGEILVGSPHYDGSGPSSGRVRVFSGATGLLLDTCDGDAPGDQFGTAVSGTADLDGDGTDDFLVGAIEHNLFGYARVFSGKTRKPRFTVGGDSVEGDFGWSVSGTGDLNGDGYADLLIGEPGDDTIGASSGSIHVVSGAFGPVTHYGDGCAAGTGFIPLLAASGDTGAMTGKQFDVLISNAQGGTSALIVFGTTVAAVPMAAGCTLNVAPLLPAVVALPVGGAGPGNGSVSLSVIIPAALSGLTFTMQAFIADPWALFGFTNTNGVLVEVL